MLASLIRVLPLLASLNLGCPVLAQASPRVWASGEETLFLAGDGTFHRMGKNVSGRRGVGDKFVRYQAVFAPVVPQIQEIGLGLESIHLVKSDGTLWVAGFHRLIPGGTAQTSLDFVQAEPSTDWATVAAGSEHALAIKTDGSLWAWGSGSSGQLGLGGTSSFWSPTRIGTGTDWWKISVRGSVNYAIKTNGTMWRWGSSLGSIPTQFGTLQTWTQVSHSDSHVLAVQSDGSLWAWGSNTYGQLGRGNTISSTTPVRVGTANNWLQVSAGRYSSLGLRADGSLWAWGGNFSGQLGLGDTNGRTSPVQVMVGTSWVAVSAGDDHTAAIRSDHALFTWGANSNGQLGRTGTNAISPEMVDLSPRSDVAMVRPPNDQSIADGGSYTYPQTAIGNPVVFGAALLNLGSVPLQITQIALHQAFAHNIALPLEIPPSGRQDFQVTSTASAGGNFSTPLTLSSNDPDEADFEITLNSLVLSNAEDSDSDGLSDAAEWHLSGFGFRWNVPNSDLLNTLVTEGHRAGVYTEQEFLQGDANSATGKRQPDSGRATIRLRLEQGPDLLSLGPAVLDGVLITTDGKLQVPVVSPGRSGFFRFAFEPLPLPAP